MAHEHIVICDDEPEVRASLMDYLEGRGYRVSGASNGEALARLLNVQKPDLVILDVNMPKIDGLAALQAIRAKSALPVIMLTGADEDMDRILGLEMGADDYVGKPANPRELEARVRAVLRRGRPQAETAAEPDITFFGLKLEVAARRLFDPLGVEIQRASGKPLDRVILRLAHGRGIDVAAAGAVDNVDHLRLAIGRLL